MNPLDSQAGQQSQAIDPSQQGQVDPQVAQVQAYAAQQQQVQAQQQLQQEKMDVIIHQNFNLAVRMPDEDLDAISTTLVKGIDADKQSCQEYFDTIADYLKLASQVKETKSWPWPKASNVKYPLLTMAALQFNARAYDALLPGPRIVKGRVVGYDPQNIKKAKADRISIHMSYQLLEEMETWCDDTDKLLFILPITGTVFKKTYNCDGYNYSDLVLPQDLIVNYYAKSLSKANRVTQVLEYYENEIEEYIRAGTFTKFDYKQTQEQQNDSTKKVTTELKLGQGQVFPTGDSDIPHLFYECHCWWDLDEDDYKEPYIVTIHKNTGKVVRIIARYNSQSITYQGKDQKVIQKIKPDEYFTGFVFVPDGTSGVYGLGFGHLLGPINETSNTLINQLVDSGTLQNMPSGFLTKGVRVQQGTISIEPGKYNYVNSVGDDIRKSIYQHQFQGPNGVLLNLLNMLIAAGQQVTTVSQEMMGKSPGQNTPWSTTKTVLDQGMKVFNSIFKRIHRAFKYEFKKIYTLNKYYLDPQEYFTVVDPNTGNDVQGSINQDDYNSDDTDVIPYSDPDIVSDAEKLQKAQALDNLANQGKVNPQVSTRMILNALEIENANDLLQIPPPQPDFDQQIKLKQLELEKQQIDNTDKTNAFKNHFKSVLDEAQATLFNAQAQAAVGDQKFKALEAMMELKAKEYEGQIAQVKMLTEHVKADREMAKTQNEMQQQQDTTIAKGMRIRKYNRATKAFI